MSNLNQTSDAEPLMTPVEELEHRAGLDEEHGRRTDDAELGLPAVHALPLVNQTGMQPVGGPAAILAPTEGAADHAADEEGRRDLTDAGGAGGIERDAGQTR